MKKLITILLIIVMAVGMIVPAYAENIQSRAVIGADLTDDQIAAVYNAFGIKRGDAIELRVTNGEERQWLQGYVDENGNEVPFTPSNTTGAIANTKIGGETILPILYWLVLALVLHIVSRHTPFGRRIYAIGSNERTARLSGIHVERVKTWIYILMGALVAVTAVIQVARIGSMDYANAGSGYEMDAIAAVVVGGTSMSGGKGSIGGTVLGMLIIAVMNNLLNLIGVPPFLREAFKGIIVIGAVLLQKKEKAS